jgi:serine/threonine-protein kinase RsbW
MSETQRIEISFPSRVEFLNLVHTVTDEMARMAGFDGDESLNISLAVREAATNALIHGNGRDESKLVQVVFGVGEGSISVDIEDQGTGFNPEDVDDPRDPTNVGRTSGRGIFLMRSFMDAVSFTRSNSDGMHVSMCKSVGRDQSQEDSKS